MTARAPSTGSPPTSSVGVSRPRCARSSKTGSRAGAGAAGCGDHCASPRPRRFTCGQSRAGLESILAENGDIASRHEAHGSSGLVRDDSFDWSGDASRCFWHPTPDIDIASMAIGLNDRQALRVDGEALAPSQIPGGELMQHGLTPSSRPFRLRGVPLILGGAAPRAECAASPLDLGQINELIKERSRRKGAISCGSLGRVRR